MEVENPIVEEEPTQDLEVELETDPIISLGPLIADRHKLGLSCAELLEKVKTLIANGADVNDESRNGHRPLLLAIDRGYEEVALLLIEAGADIHRKDRDGLDPIHKAINHSEFKIAKSLVDHGAHFAWVIPDLHYDYPKWYKFRYFYL